jgi:hypothetical protein
MNFSVRVAKVDQAAYQATLHVAIKGSLSINRLYRALITGEAHCTY